ncbi:hypothetical protein BKA70DRAFT_1451194 [Coprinopsis sp. MPI-PUGE-AT-0042]|nr:hypothetical protein BKA70DRAFT_1451194 [Coprinopsis sp. MPI-PUGE-AT-0042]
MATRASGLQDNLTEKEIEVKVYGLVGIWMETFLYGIYLLLFITAMRVLSRKQALHRFSSKVFFTGIIIMFILITIHNGLNIYRLIVGFGHAANVHEPVQYLTNFLQWENSSLSILLALIFWSGDTLVIYRCFLIWQRNYWIIALPLTLFLASVATHTTSIWSARHFALDPSAVPHSLPPFLNMLFPLYAAQNVVTTLPRYTSYLPRPPGVKTHGLCCPQHSQLGFGHADRGGECSDIHD